MANPLKDVGRCEPGGTGAGDTKGAHIIQGTFRETSTDRGGCRHGGTHYTATERRAGERLSNVWVTPWKCALPWH